MNKFKSLITIVRLMLTLRLMLTVRLHCLISTTVGTRLCARIKCARIKCVRLSSERVSSERVLSDRVFKRISISSSKLILALAIFSVINFSATAADQSETGDNTGDDTGDDTEEEIVETDARGTRQTAPPLGENVEQHLVEDDDFTVWVQDETLFLPKQDDTIEIQRKLKQEATTLKLNDVVPPIYFKSGESDIPRNFIGLLRDVLESVKDRNNVRLHFVGHTDNVPLRGTGKEKYGDNFGLSRDRAEIAAEFFQRELDLPPEAVTYDGVGSTKPIANNATSAGKAKNRRVAVEVWYDEISEKVVEEEVLVEAPKLDRVKICRTETVCKLSYTEGHSKRARLKNLIKPLSLADGETEIPENYLRQIRQILNNLKDKNNVMIRFVGHTDNIPLMDRASRIYGDHVGYSKARARRLALRFQEILGLPNAAISTDGKGLSQPIASNDSMSGRSLNKRVELEFWHDDPLEKLPDEPQACPDAATAETITRVFDPPTGKIKPVFFKDGQPVISMGYPEQLGRLMDYISEKSSVRLKFIGYTNNERMTRRAAMVYGDDIGLSKARARRTMEMVRDAIGLTDKQVEFEGRGFVHSDDIVNTGFVEFDSSRVEVQVVYDELAMLDEEEGLEVTKIIRNTETKNPYSLNFMRITVDGKPLHDPNKNIPDLQRCTDVELEKVDIQFKFDSLDLKPRLNVTAFPNIIAFEDNPYTEQRENLIIFRTYSNYSTFIEHKEIRIFEKERSRGDEPAVVLRVNKDGMAQWEPGFYDYTAPGEEYQYLLRVYDKEGNYDETATQTIWVIDEITTETEVSSDSDELLTGYGENRLAINNIPLKGGKVKVNGRAIPEDHTVWVAGRPVPLNNIGEFVSEEIYPQGLHTFEVAVLDEGGNGELYLRELEFKSSDWFYVGIADLTVAQDSTNGPAELVTGDETHYDNDLSIDGRLAFFADGKFGDHWELRTSADTLDGPIEDLFSNFIEKSPDALFRRIDPDYYHPTYGDDSTVEETSPTQGKFYLKLKKKDSYGLWGNFKVDYTDNNLSHVDRGLYGSNLRFETESATSFGEKRFLFDGFAAEPGTLAGRDEFRGTSGSLYFMRHRDILAGSDRLRVEIRDKDSGLVIGVKNLTPAIDYDLDYIQGRVLLSEPLSAYVDDKLVVDSSSSSGHVAYLVARYEYTPGFEEIDDIATGARVHYWVGDYLKLGVTNSQQGESGNESRLNGVDLTLRKSAGTWLKIETASTQGQGLESQNSNDGGFNFEQQGSTLPPDPDQSAGAYRVEGRVNLSDLFDDSIGAWTFYSQYRDAGFSAPGQFAQTETAQFGTTLSMALSETMKINIKGDRKDVDKGIQLHSMDVDLSLPINDSWSLSSGVRGEKREDRSPDVPLTQKEGERYDLALRFAYDSREKWAAYTFAQFTMNTTGNRQDNDRIGVGTSYRATDRLKYEGELSTGDLGEGAKLGTEYLMSDRTTLYLNYALENERTDNGLKARRGNMSTGFRTRYSDTTTIYMEERYSHGDVPTGLTHSLGVDLAPDDHWNFGLNLDIGTLEDQETGAQTERTAVGARMGYGSDSMTYATALEYRVDNSENPDTTLTERSTWLIKNSLKYQITPGWRLIGKLDHSVSESTQGEFYDGNYTEAVVGYGYRPVTHDKLNTLMKYTYFNNVPSSNQVTINNTAAEFIQKTHILSMDAIYDLSQRWSVGFKYAYRASQVSQDRVDPEFFDSRANLYVVRADWHFVKRWDLLMEARMLALPDAQDQRSGGLVGFYYHMGDNIKIGVGYNFTDFSDDLTDLDYDSQGFFINLVGKM